MDDKQIDAMCLAFIEGCDPGDFEYVSDERGGDLSAIVMDGTFDLRAGMRAAIEAMREPTVPMMVVGSEYTDSDYGQAKACWQAMIAHVLDPITPYTNPLD